jgi:flagellar biogenesis protein FliO
MKQNLDGGAASSESPAMGVAGWLLNRLRGARRGPPRLAVLERIALAPRQSLVLVEADGRRFLVATSPEGAPAFYPLHEPPWEKSSEPMRDLKPGARLAPELGDSAILRSGLRRSRASSMKNRASTSRDARARW